MPPVARAWFCTPLNARPRPYNRSPRAVAAQPLCIVAAAQPLPEGGEGRAAKVKGSKSRGTGRHALPPAQAPAPSPPSPRSHRAMPPQHGAPPFPSGSIVPTPSRGRISIEFRIWRFHRRHRGTSSGRSRHSVGRRSTPLAQPRPQSATQVPSSRPLHAFFKSSAARAFTVAVRQMPE
jgi:hypothetical protein